MNIPRNIFVLVLILTGGISTRSMAQSWPSVPAVDLSTLRPSNFTDEELDIPYYLKHFHRVANSIIENGPDKGYINISVWRNLQGNKTYNARIMENILSLAFFYCTNRPWNVYFGHPAVRTRLEAALNFWCRTQNSDGRFSEYGPQLWNLPATAFATKFMGEALILLKAGPPIDQQVLQKTIEADRKAIMVVLTNDSLYNSGKNFSNQFTNVYAGALAYMSLFKDSIMYANLKNCLSKSAKDFQSPAGFFYEAGGVDFGYNFNTHHSNLWMAYHYSRGTELAKYFVEEEARYYDWIKFNAVPEPAGYYTINRGIEMRQKTPVIHSYFLVSPLSESVEGIRAFNETKEEKQQNIIRTRKALELNWPEVPALILGEFSAFSPYAFLHRRHYSWKPDSVQKKKAVEQLPYIKNTHFIHQKVDSRHPFVFTYVRTPGYYAAFNAGPQLKSQQRLGLGLMWHPGAGSFLQSQTDSDTAAWGTKNAENKLYEAGPISALFTQDKKNIQPSVGNNDLGAGILSISYELADKGKKSLSFRDDRIDIDVKHTGIFREHIPLLFSPGDNIEIRKGKLTLKKDGLVIQIVFSSAAKSNIIETNAMSGTQRVLVLVVESTDRLNYSIQISR